uniref:Replication protein A 70 kDa DNA-binding subunit n=1 Tax=Lingulaulax polyedra TaxID=160621 RepID=A0A516AG63_LINPO|nr:replication protein A 70 kDa DNA-binding subunit [Lingulodinium polyedra]
MSLTGGCVPGLLSGELVPQAGAPCPVLQVLQTLPARPGAGEGWALVLSDGEHHLRALLAEGLHASLPGMGAQAQHSIVELQDWAPPAEVRGQPCVSVRALAPLGFAQGVIGNPRSYQPSWGPAPAPLPTPEHAAMPGHGSSNTSPLQQQPYGALAPQDNMARSGPVPQANAQAAGITPIARLGPHTQHWRVRARVTGKSDVRHFTNARGEGQCFSVELVDREGGEVKATFFGAAVDKFFNLLAPQGVFEISGGSVKPGNPRFTRHAVDITLDERGTVRAAEDDGSIPGVQFDFVPLSSLAELAEGTSVDVAAVVVSALPPTTITTRTGASRMRHAVMLVDESGCTCRLTLWGAQAEANVGIGAGTVLFVRNARITEFNGLRGLDSTDTGIVEAEPSGQRAMGLRKLFEERGEDLARQGLAAAGRGGPRRMLAECAAEGATLLTGLAEGPAGPAGRALTVSPATVTRLPGVEGRPPFYMACDAEVPAAEGRPRPCKRKATASGRGWCCPAGHQCATASPRYSFQVKLADPTAELWAGLFDEEARELLGVPAAELSALWESQEAGDLQAGARLQALLRAAAYRRVSVRLRSRRDVWEGRERVRVTAAACSRVDLVSEAFEMLAGVRQACAAGALCAAGA